MRWSVWNPGAGRADEADGLGQALLSLSSRLRTASSSIKSASRAVDDLTSEAIASWQAQAGRLATMLDVTSGQMVTAAKAFTTYADAVRALAARANGPRQALERLPGVGSVAEGGMAAHGAPLSGWTMGELTSRCLQSWSEHATATETTPPTPTHLAELSETIRSHLAALNDLARRRQLADHTLAAELGRISSAPNGYGDTRLPEPSHPDIANEPLRLAANELIVRAWEDSDFLLRAVQHPHEVLHELGYTVPDGMTITVVPDSPSGISVILPPHATAADALEAVQFGLEHQVPVVVVQETADHTFVRIPPAPAGLRDPGTVAYNLTPSNMATPVKSWTSIYAHAWIVMDIVMALEVFQVALAAIYAVGGLVVFVFVVPVVFII